MNSFLILDDEDMNFIWDTIQKIQIIFHPEIAPYGEFDFEKFYEIKRKKSIILFACSAVSLFILTTTVFLFFK